jgi:ABC-2 type transport system permease protein
MRSRRVSRLSFAHPPDVMQEVPRGTDLRGMIFREVRLLTRNRVNFVFSMLPTLVYLLLMNTSLSNLVGKIHYHGTTLPYATFLLPMVLMSATLSASMMAGMAMFQEELSGVATELWSYPLRRSRYLAGKIATGIGVVILQTLVALLVAVFVLNVHLAAANWAGLAVALVVTAATFNALYLVVALSIRDFQLFSILMNMSMPILLFASPSLYNTSDMPLVLRWISVVNPVTYGITAMRDAASFGLAAAWPWLLVFIIIAPIAYLLASTALLRRVTRM